MISVEVKGDFSNLRKFLKRRKYDSILKKYGELGVSLLRSATPKRTGKTSESWSYKITMDENILQLVFCNSNTNKSVCIAVLLQYGHVTGTGGWVEGIDYINPVIGQLTKQLEAELDTRGLM